MGLPIFSVIIPIYNVEQYIAQCIQSVLNQTFNNFEIICVDDGSPDASVAIVEQFDDCRIRVVHQENKGLAAARNTGINHARGMYVALLDADDFWVAEKLEKHFEHFQSNSHVDVSYAPSVFVDEQGESLGFGQCPQIKNVSAEDIYFKNPVGNGSAAVMRRAFLMRVAEYDNHDGEYRVTYFDENMRQSEDVEFWLRSCLVADACYEGIGKGLGQALTYYRINNSGLSANLEKQFESWQYIMLKNQQRFPEFFKKNYAKAESFQKRYLARRAIKSYNGAQAMHLMRESLCADWKIILHEPVRTMVTVLCALLVNLPNTIYKSLEKKALECCNKMSRFDHVL